MVTNDAAERLRTYIDEAGPVEGTDPYSDFDEALATAFDEGKALGESEGRRATVERIRTAVDAIAEPIHDYEVYAILDKEAEPPKHRDTCSIHGGWECDCGLDAVSARSAEPDDPAGAER